MEQSVKTGLYPLVYLYLKCSIVGGTRRNKTERFLEQPEIPVGEYVLIVPSVVPLLMEQCSIVVPFFVPFLEQAVSLGIYGLESVFLNSVPFVPSF